MKNKAILAIIMVAVMLVGCGGVEDKVTSKTSKEKEEKIEDVMEKVTKSGGEDESLEDTAEDVVEEETSEPVPAENATPTETTKSESKSTQQKTETKKKTEAVAPTVTMPVVTAPETKSCEHNWEQEEFYYDIFKKVTFGCNGCGLALFEWSEDRSSVEHIENLYFHEPCPTDRFPEPCSGGGYHNESVTIGFCGLCSSGVDDPEGRVAYRQCMWTEMGKRCSKNTVLGEYEKVEFNQNHFMYYDSCKCGKNMIFVNGRDDDYENAGKGIIFGKEKCTVCGTYKGN